jgi:hypothetical protein
MADYDIYEEQIEDIKDFVGTDIKINPSYYIHIGILKAQEALNDPEIKTGVYKFRFFIENIETLAKAAELLPTDYEEKIKEFRNKEEYKNAENEYIKSFKLANYKLELILSQVFGNKSSDMALSLK